MPPRISVVLPVHNGGVWFEEALDSLANQTWSDFEVLLQNDGSTDDTQAVAERRAVADPRFRTESGPARGVAQAANRAAARARAPLLVRMDADDRCRPDRLEKLVALADAEPEVGLFASRVRYFPRHVVGPGMRHYEAWLNSLCTHAQIYASRYVEYPLPHPTTMIRRTTWDTLGGYRDGPFPEDYEFFLRAAAQGVRFAKHGDILLDWRESEIRTTKHDARYHLDAFRTAKCMYLAPHLRQLDRPVAIVGAGSDGKRWATALAAAGIAPRWFIDAHPARRGQIIRGAKVLSPDEIGAIQGAFFLSAVGKRGARPGVRAALRDAGLVEESDFLCVQ